MYKHPIQPSEKCHHKQHKKYSQVFYVNCLPRPKPEPEPKPKPIVHCCLGNLILNGQFDTWIESITPEHWDGSNIVMSPCSHTGVIALQMGKLRGCDDHISTLPSSLFQTFSVCPKQLIQLKFYLALLVKHNISEGSVDPCEIGNPFVEAKIVWLDHANCEIGIGACVTVPPNSLGLGWFSFQIIPSPVPPNAKKAKLVFTKAKGFPVILDDVSIVVL